MCRNIKPLRKEAEWTDEDVRASSLQYVRKLSGYRKPAQKNVDVFDQAVEEVYQTTKRMLMKFAPDQWVEEHSNEWMHEHEHPHSHPHEEAS